MPQIVSLRDVNETDLPSFFEDQLDSDANEMAAFTPRNHDTFMTHWKNKVLADNSVTKKTILFDRQVAGNIVCYEQDGKKYVGYWIGKTFWGKGVATQALTQFLGCVTTRPLYAYVAKRNVASIRVLEKCGFVVQCECRRPSDGHFVEVEEFLMILKSKGES